MDDETAKSLISTLGELSANIKSQPTQVAEAVAGAVKTEMAPVLEGFKKMEGETAAKEAIERAGLKTKILAGNAMSEAAIDNAPLDVLRDVAANVAEPAEDGAANVNGNTELKGNKSEGDEHAKQFEGYSMNKAIDDALNGTQGGFNA